MQRTIFHFFLLAQLLLAPQILQAAGFRCAVLFNQSESLPDAEVFKFVSDHLSEAKTDTLINKFLQIFGEGVLGGETAVMTESQFYKLFSSLKTLAGAYDIRIESKLDTMGVFPEGLHLIKIAGFSEPSATNSNLAVGFARRHELAHLFHVIALRAILVENKNELSGLSPAQLTQLVADLESGGNYLEFEKIVTDISGVLHIFSPLKSANGRYGEKLSVLLTGLKTALLSGKVHFKNGWSVIEIYAKFVSKAPLVLGTSFAQLSVRLPFIYFATHLVVNGSFRAWVEFIMGAIQ